MSVLFKFQSIRWNSSKSEIKFEGCFLSNKKGKRFQVDGVKRIVAKGESLYLCKIKRNLGKHIDEVFKFLVLDDETIKGYDISERQLVGKNVNGQFMFDSDFYQGMRKVNQMSHTEKIDLSAPRES